MVTCYTDIQPKQYAMPHSLGVQQATIQVCVSALCDVHITKLPNDTFLRTYPSCSSECVCTSFPPFLPFLVSKPDVTFFARTFVPSSLSFGIVNKHSYNGLLNGPAAGSSLQSKFILILEKLPQTTNMIVYLSS